MKKDISDKQKTILDFIKKEVSTKGYPPTVREICKAVGLKSPSTVHTHLNKLQANGYIKRDPTKPRAIILLNHKNDEDDKNNVIDFKSKKEQSIMAKTKFIPIIGEITAGEPILAREDFDSMFPISQEFTQDGDYYMLKIKGESMIEAGILDKDLVLVKQQNDAENGEIVVALIEDSATVKTFYKESKQIRLQPENQTMSPIIVDDVKILGVVKGVFRSM